MPVKPIPIAQLTEPDIDEGFTALRESGAGMFEALRIVHEDLKILVRTVRRLDARVQELERGKK